MILYSRKLTDAQQIYTVTEIYFLSIFETLKEFRTILLGQRLRIYTDHKNLTYNNFNTNRLLIWRLILKDYGPDIEYIKGEKKILAYTLSRSPLNRDHDTTKKSTYTKEIVSEINDTK